MPYTTEHENQGHAPACEESSPAQRRRDERKAVLWVGYVCIAGRPNIACAVLDVSAGGAKVRVSEPVAQGELVSLKSPHFSRKARVVWSADGAIGLQFIERGARFL
jgi:hypothetical protein